MFTSTQTSEQNEASLLWSHDVSLATMYQTYGIEDNTLVSVLVEVLLSEFMQSFETQKLCLQFAWKTLIFIAHR